MLYVNVGRRELGKTTLALHLTRNVRPRVIFDPRALCPAPNGRAVVPEQVTQAFDLLEQDDSGLINRFEIVVTPDRDTQTLFDYVCSECKSWLQRQRPLALIVDESTFVDLEESDAFEWIIRQAPRQLATVVLTQHRPFDVPIRIRAIADCWCVFRTTEPRDLIVIAERTNDDFARQVNALRPHQFMSWDDRFADSRIGVHLDPEKWKVKLTTEVPDGSGVAAQSRVELPASNSPQRKELTLFDDGT